MSRDTTSKVVTVDYKGCDSVKVEFNKLTVTFHNRLTGNFWQKTYSAHQLTMDQIKDWAAGQNIQRAMPELSDNDREHFITGFTEKEIVDFFGA